MRRRLFGLAVILLVASGVNTYAECVPPPPLADVTTKVDTEGAVAKVLKFAGITLKADIEVERKSIFTQFPNANQMVVALIAIYQYCTQLETVKTLTDEQKLEKLAAYQTTWLMAAVGPQAIATTVDKKDGAAPDKPSKAILRARLRPFCNSGPTLSLLAMMHPSLIGVSKSWRWQRATRFPQSTRFAHSRKTAV
jgi:hypothetical protein